MQTVRCVVAHDIPSCIVLESRSMHIGAPGHTGALLPGSSCVRLLHTVEPNGMLLGFMCFRVLHDGN